jgi:hypothetical protein
MNLVRHQRWPRRALLWRLGLALLLGAGLARSASAQSAMAFDGQYVGELTLVSVISGDCTKPPLGSLYPLTISPGQVRFLYTPRFSTTLIGTVERNGVFKASARAHKGIVTMTGRVRGSNVTATIVSPSCNYNFQTKR